MELKVILLIVLFVAGVRSAEEEVDSDVENISEFLIGLIEKYDISGKSKILCRDWSHTCLEVSFVPSRCLPYRQCSIEESCVGQGLSKRTAARGNQRLHGEVQWHRGGRTVILHGLAEGLHPLPHRKRRKICRDPGYILRRYPKDQPTI